ncbi:MAG: selenophosphate synthase [Saprospiraceae bacterium]|jgi:selenophosphate synthase
MRTILIIIISALSIVSCSRAQEATLSQEGANHFGAKITEVGAKDIAGIISNFDGNDTIDVKISGVINEVCQAKGCWMTLEDEASATSAFVKFKDYAFFVPKDAGGKKAIVQGKLYGSLTLVDELRHYAEDKGASNEEIAAITEPEREIKMMVEGVIIYN